jgi:hypothetical protein
MRTVYARWDKARFQQKACALRAMNQNDLLEAIALCKTLCATFTPCGLQQDRSGKPAHCLHEAKMTILRPLLDLMLDEGIMHV